VSFTFGEIPFDPKGPDWITLSIAALAMLLVAIVRWWRGIQPYMTRRRAINDFLHASALFPFALLFLSSMSSTVFGYVQSSTLSLGLAGGVGLIFVIGELIASGSRDRPDDQD
jgi:hypothetical protein